MIKKHLKKFFVISIIAILIYINDLSKVYAAGPFFGGNGDETGGSSGKPAVATKTDGSRTTTCTWSTSSTSYSWVYVEAYDAQGNKIDDIKNINTDILAGTYIGLNIYETKGYSKASTYEVKSEEKVYDCQYRYICGYKTISYDQNDSTTIPSTLKNTDTSNNIIQLSPTFIPVNPDIYHDEGGGKQVPTFCYRWEHNQESCGANATAKNEKTTVVEPTPEEVAWCKSIATPTHSALSGSYKITYKDSNDINSEPSTSDEYNTAMTHTGNGNCSSVGPTNSGNTIIVSKSCIFYYNREKNCINVKNGKVRYVDEDEQCDTDVEYELTTNDKYWKYFIPLNTKSKEGFSFIMNSSGNKQSSGICQNIIDNYDDYKNLITDSNGNTFNANDTKRTAKEKVKNGCYYQSSVTIPVIQKFYNETDEGKFKGFNIYYKPIDINNPFPNGMDETSIWYEWSKSTEQKLEISKSYNEVTYYAQISNTNSIRNYTKEHPYTSWDNMYVNGASEFIEKEGIIKRNIDRNSYYQLGCGPSNENEYTDATKTVKNVFYQKECDRK